MGGLITKTENLKKQMSNTVIAFYSSGDHWFCYNPKRWILDPQTIIGFGDTEILAYEDFKKKIKADKEIKQND